MADDPGVYLDDGRDLLREVAAPLGTWPAFAAADVGLPEPARRRALLGVIDATKERLVSTTRNFARKALRRVPAIGSWAKDFQAAVGAGHMAGLMAATGTIDPAPADVAVAIGTIRKQAGFLARFRKQVAEGVVVLGSLVGPSGAPLPPNTPAASRPVAAKVLDRAAMYGDAIWGGTAGVLRARMIRDGFDEERRVLGGSEHSCPECPSLAARGWQPIGSQPGIGETVCRSRCRCHFEYRHAESGRVEVPVAGPGPGAAPKFGPSPVVAGYEGGLDPASPEALAIRLQARDVLGLRSAKDAMAKVPGLVGAPAGATVEVGTFGDFLEVRVSHPEFQAKRMIYRDGDEVTIENSSFHVKPRSQGKGLGAEVFGRQVEQAAEMGARRIVTEAAGGGGQNGYYTWPRFGYDADIPASVRPDLPPALRGVARVSDLMRTPAGRAAWKEHGGTIEAEFDLRAGSLSRRVWDAYRAEKAARPSLAPAAATPSAPRPARAPRRPKAPAAPPIPALTPEQLAAVGKDGPLLPNAPIADRIAAYRAGGGGAKLEALKAALDPIERQAIPLRDRIDAIDAEMDGISAKLGLRGKQKIPAAERDDLVTRSAALSRERHDLNATLDPLKAESSRAVFAALRVDNPLAIDRQGGDLVQHFGTLVRPSGPSAQRVVTGGELLTGITRAGDAQAALAIKFGMFDEYGRAFAIHYTDVATVAIDRSNPATVVVHEIAHVVESKLTTAGEPLVRRSKEFLDYRAGDEPIRSFREAIGTHYGSDERGRKDKFDEAFGTSGWYVGKDYGERSSEILSMGVQKLYEDPARFLDRDPEYVAYVVGALDGSLR